MNINKMYNYTSILHNCGIKAVVFSPSADGHMNVSGIDEDYMIAVMHDTKDHDLCDEKVGLTFIEPFVKKMKLLDLSKTRVEIETVEIDDDKYTKAVVLKEGRRSVQHSFCSPNTAGVPISRPDGTVSTIIQLDASKTKALLNAIATYSPDKVEITADGSSITLSLTDDNNDVYSDVLQDTDQKFSFEWKRTKFVKLLNNVKNDEGSQFGFTDKGLMFFVISDLPIMLAPTMA